MDDSLLVQQPNWLAEMKQQIVMKKPKVIVVWNWDINNTQISRFATWAKPLYRYIGEAYDLKAKIAQNDKDESWYEVYVLK